jgi:hypothetical protein
VKNLASFFLGSIVTAAVGLLFSKRTKQDKNGLGDQPRLSITAEIRSEQLSRNTLFFGDDGMNRLNQTSIVVIGLGGVGSHTAHMLARAGVGYLRLIDFDQVKITLRRIEIYTHILAMHLILFYINFLIMTQIGDTLILESTRCCNLGRCWHTKSSCHEKVFREDMP